MSRSHARAPGMQQVTIAIPKSLVAAIEAKALKERRNRNNMIQVLLEDAVMAQTVESMTAKPVVKGGVESKQRGAVLWPVQAAPRNATGGAPVQTRR